MSYEIVPTPEFVKEAKRLAKKFPKMPQDLEALQNILLENPKAGTPLGHDCYKLRLQNTSIKKGKSGGFRIILFLIDKNKVIRLLAIYSKTERDTISDEEIKKVLKKNNLI